MLDAPTKANSLYLVKKKLHILFHSMARSDSACILCTSKEEVEAIVRAEKRTAAQMDGREIRKVIVVPGRIINIVG